jgi:hypothetical protein
VRKLMRICQISNSRITQEEFDFYWKTNGTWLVFSCGSVDKCWRCFSVVWVFTGRPTVRFGLCWNALLFVFDDVRVSGGKLCCHNRTFFCGNGDDPQQAFSLLWRCMCVDIALFVPTLSVAVFDTGEGPQILTVMFAVR